LTTIFILLSTKLLKPIYQFQINYLL